MSATRKKRTHNILFWNISDAYFFLNDAKGILQIP